MIVPSAAADTVLDFRDGRHPVFQVGEGVGGDMSRRLLSTSRVRPFLEQPFRDRRELAALAPHRFSGLQGAGIRGRTSVLVRQGSDRNPGVRGVS